MLAAKDMDKTVKGLEDLCAPSKRLFVVSVAKKVTEFSLDQSKRSMEELDSVLKELWNHVCSEKPWDKQDDIPRIENVMTLGDHLRMVEDEAQEKVTQESSSTAYKMLNETVLAQLIIINKASRLTL